MKKLILIHRVHILDNIVPDLLERDRINERMVLDNDLCLGWTKIKMQSARPALNGRNDGLRTGIRVDVIPIERGRSLLSAIHGARYPKGETVL